MEKENQINDEIVSENKNFKNFLNEIIMLSGMCIGALVGMATIEFGGIGMGIGIVAGSKLATKIVNKL
jgi:hypothetical protein